MEEPVLDLKTLVERPRITIDGEAYEILSHDELSVLDHHQFAYWGRRIDKLMAKNQLTEKNDEELKRLIDLMSDKIMVGVPDEVRGKLTDAQRLDVAEVFTSLRTVQSLSKAMEMLGQDGATQSTGAKRSRGSKGSTAGDQTGGLPTPRKRSSKRT